MARLKLAPGTVRGGAVGRTVAALLRAEDLPSALDTRALMPPTMEALVRRVAVQNVWLWYRVQGREIVLLTVTDEPPVTVE
jgi:hypothetical protein